MKTIVSAIALALASVSASAIAAPAADTATQLPRTARPLHYAITIAPEADKLHFTGKAEIVVEITAPARSLTLHAADLAFTTATIRAEGKPVQPATVAVDAKAETAVVTFPTEFAPGRYTLAFDYTGKINQQANGLFALDYKDTKGTDKRALFTQFEPGDARRMFPGWDEPSYKASYDLALVLPAGLMPVANTPVKSQTTLADGRIAYSFERTPVMSSYLAFVGAGEFDRIAQKAGKTEVGVITGRGNAEKARYALDASVKILPYFEDYFGKPFPMPKLDNVAGPGQSQFFSAMENWGAIFSFERVLLLDPALSSEADRQRIFEVAAHEIAHQWFGNLVTMAWWNDLWLNEGFASWMAGKTMAHFNPDWEAELEDVSDRERAMNLDGLRTTHPVVQKVDTVEQASQAFDAITYSKGKAVITMLEGYAGADVWRQGLRAYMDKHQYGNTVTTDLWGAIEAAGAKGLTAIAADFTSKPGIPLISVADGKCVKGETRVSLKQGEFSLDDKAGADAKPLSWQVPVTAGTLGSKPTTAIVSGSASLAVPGCGPLIVNKGQTGYYRTLYSKKQTGAISKAFTKLDPIDQLGILSDASALGYAGYMPAGWALDLANATPNTANPRLLTLALDELSSKHRLFAGDAATQAKLAAHIIKRFAPVREDLGFVARAADTAPVSLLRADVIATLGELGDPVITAEARRQFAALDGNPTAMDGPLKKSWLAALAAHADAAIWEKMHAHAKAETQQLARSNWYRLLAEARDPKLAQRALDLALTDEPGPTLSASILQTVALNHPDLAVTFALDRLDKVETFVDGSSRTRYIGSLASAARNPAIVDLLEGYAKAKLTPDSRKPIDQAQARIRTRAASDPRVRAQVKAWLSKNAR